MKNVQLEESYVATPKNIMVVSSSQMLHHLGDQKVSIENFRVFMQTQNNKSQHSHLQVYNDLSVHSFIRNLINRLAVMLNRLWSWPTTINKMQCLWKSTQELFRYVFPTYELIFCFTFIHRAKKRMMLSLTHR